MKSSRIALALLSLAVASIARAGVTVYTNEATFQGLGTIDFNTNFDAFGPYFGFPGDPFTTGDVTYHSTQNLTWGNQTGYTTTRPLIGNNWWTPIDGSINTTPAYNMFGFEIGTYNSSTISFDIYTNLGTYNYPSLTIADSTQGLLDFKGFVASGGEYFTGFKITADNGGGNLPGITEVQVGHTGTQQVPDGGSSLMLLGAGLGFVAWMRRRRA